MSAPQIVATATAAAVAVAIALVCAGVAILAGAGWALIAAGVMVGPSAIAAASVLLRDSDPSR